MIGTRSDGRTLRRLAALVSLLAALGGCAALAFRTVDSVQTASRLRSPQNVVRAQSTWLLFGCLQRSLHHRIPKGAAIFIEDPTLFAQQRLAEFAFWDYRVVDRASEAQYQIGLSRLPTPACSTLSLTVTRR
jgi:hypothetical protein